MKYIIRKSAHIQEDIQRNWSSWNFGEEGVKASSEDELITILEKQIEVYGCAFISGFQLTELDDCEFGELYPGYWVMIDDRFTGGLAGTELKADNLEDAKAEGLTASTFGDGYSFDAESAIYHGAIAEDLHLFEVEEYGW